MLCFAFLFFSCKKENQTEPIQLFGNVFGTTYNIIYFDSNKNFSKEINSLFDQVNQSTSTYIPSSDISRINRGEEGIKVDEYFKEVFVKSQKIYSETNGYFDPTVGSLVNAWGFGPEKPLTNLSKYQIDSIMQFVGLDKIKLVDNTVVKQKPEVYLDFNAIGKGYGIDVIGRFLESKGIQNYLIEIGGEIRCRGLKPNGDQWGIQIDAPNTDGSRTAYDILKLTNVSVASSGNYRKFRTSSDGQKFVHTVNPKSGEAKESNLLTATVIANLDCADVDAYATAFMAMGFEKTKMFLLQKPEIKVVLIYVDENENIKDFRN